MKPEGSLSCLQEPDICHFPETDGSSPCHFTTFLKAILISSSHLNLALPWFRSFRFPHQNLVRIYLLPHLRHLILRNIYLRVLLPTAHLLSPLTTTLLSAFLSLYNVNV
jgi:hypothetical protein